jgi:membrane protease YdiL (CAAX protease family)
MKETSRREPRVSLFGIYALALVVIVPLVAAAWLPPEFPHLLRQLLLGAWGLGATVVAERSFFSRGLGESLRALGFVRARGPAVIVACVASVPMWAFLPIAARAAGVEAALKLEWLPLLVGVVLVNGITEEVIHRGFVFGHLRHERSFLVASTLSAVLFGAQHLYIVATTGWTIGIASVLLAVLLSFPLAFAFERGGGSIAAPAILHTSSNAPAIVLAIPDSQMAAALLPHLGVVLISMYLVFAGRRALGSGDWPGRYLCDGPAGHAGAEDPPTGGALHKEEPRPRAIRRRSPGARS